MLRRHCGIELMMRLRLLLLVGLLSLGMCGGALACPSCSDTVAQNDAQTAGSLGAGFNASIYVMLGGFLFALGLVVRTIVKASRQTVPSPDVPPVVTVRDEVAPGCGEQAQQAARAVT